MDAKLWRVNAQDFINGAATAICIAVLPVVNEALQNGGDLLSVDWAGVGKLALTAFVGYLLRKFVTTKDGNFLGVVKT